MRLTLNSYPDRFTWRSVVFYVCVRCSKRGRKVGHISRLGARNMTRRARWLSKARRRDDLMVLREGLKEVRENG
jgi:hypothetical protein